MRSDPYRLAEMADPVRNFHFGRRWTDRPLTPRELEHAADLAQAQGNCRRADRLSWAAHMARTAGLEAREGGR